MSDLCLTATACRYLLHLLREVDIEGRFLANPYLASVGLEGEVLTGRLRGLRGVRFQMLGDVVDLEWSEPSLRAWAERAREARPS